MKATINAASLRGGLDRVLKNVGGPQMVTLTVSCDSVYLSASGNHVSIVTVIPAESVEAEGSVTVPGAVFRKQLTLDKGPTDFEVKRGSLLWGSKSGRSTLRGTESQEYVAPGSQTGRSSFKLKACDLGSALTTTGRCSTKATHTPALSGVNVTLEKDSTITVAATDGVMACIARLPVSTEKLGSPASLLLPKDATDVAWTEDEVTVSWDKGLASFTDGVTWVTTSLLAGKFPDVSRIENPADEYLWFQLDLKELTEVLSVVSTVKQELDLIATGDVVSVLSASPEVGVIERKLNVDFPIDDPEDFRIRLSLSLLTTAVTVFKGSETLLIGRNKKTPSQPLRVESGEAEGLVVYLAQMRQD